MEDEQCKAGIRTNEQLIQCDQPEGHGDDDEHSMTYMSTEEIEVVVRWTGPNEMRDLRY